MLGPALEVVIHTVLVLKRAIVVVKLSFFAAETSSYLPQGQLRRQTQTKGQRKRKMRTGQRGISNLTAV